MKITAWDILHQDGGEYAEDISRRHKLIEDAIDKDTIHDFFITDPVSGLDLYEKLYELEKAGRMLTFEADYDKYEQKTVFKSAGLEPISYDILDLQNRRDLLAAHISAYNKTDSYDNMQEALDKYEDSLDAGRWAVLAYAIMDGQKIHPDVLPDNEDTLTLENLEYFMEWAMDHYIGEVVSEVAYNMRSDTNIRFDHNGLIDMANSKADPEILDDVKRDVIGNVRKEPEKKTEKTEIGSITCSSEYLAGGDIAQRGYTSTYYRIGDKYYEDYFSFDDYGEGDEEPVRYEIEREKIVKAFAEAYIHENTYTDVYAGNLDALADESVSYEIEDEQIQKEVERYAQDIRITKHTKEEHDSLKNIWLNGAESGEYSNSHVSVQMFIKDFTDADKERFEDLILQDQDKRRLFGGFEGAFYADITDHGSYKELSFDLHKGDFEAAKRLSKIYPEAVVFINDDWDEHNYEIYRNGKEYNDYTAEWDGDEPEPYREDQKGEEQYDIDVKVEIRLPFADAVHTCYSGGGYCTEAEFYNYKVQIETHPKEQSNEEREL